MKAYRFLEISLLVTFFVIVLSSCGGDSDEPNVDPTPIPAAARIVFPAEQNTSPVISSDGGAVSITFTSSQAWTASVVNDRADEWISLSTTNGMAGTSVLSITTKTNDTYDERSATITIKSGTISKNIIVTQKQKDAILVSSNKIEMGAEGGETQLEVKANIDFSVETDVDWISHISTRSLKTSNLTFAVAENEGTQKREGLITIKSGMLLETVTVYQAASTPTIIISQNEYTIGSDGGDIKVEVSSNIDVSVTLPEGGWINESSTRSMSTNTYMFTVSKNEGYDPRSAEILFTNKENKLSEKVTVTQMQKDAIIVAKSKYEMEAKGGSLDFEVQTNIDYDVSVDVDWITKADTRALHTEKLKFNVESNDTYDDRKASITIKGANVTQTITIIQHGLVAATGIEISQTTLELSVGSSVKLKATVLPSNASNKEVNWGSSDTRIATVDNEGNVTGVSEGKAEIVVVTADHKFSSSCIVTVSKGYDDSNPLTLEAIEAGTVTIKNPLGLVISYVKNGGSLVTSTKDDTSDISVILSAGDKLQLFGNNATYAGTTAWSNSLVLETNISCSGNCCVYGNIMSLISSDKYESLKELTTSFTFFRLFKDNKKLQCNPSKKLYLPATTLKKYCYCELFSGCSSLTIPPDLPATILKDFCYYGMFQGCTSLTKAPELPAITLAHSCYQNMFNGCTSLTTAPNLQATTLASNCYCGMLSGCTSLTAPPKLPATTLAGSCYAGLFDGCTSLTTAPELPATTLAWNCYASMFNGCTSLTTAPELPATTLEEDCYSRMFYGCTSLTTAPELQATTLVLRCYCLMFYECTNLNSVTCLATDISAEDCTISWLYGVSGEGTFTKAVGMDLWSTGPSGIPSGWKLTSQGDDTIDDSEIIVFQDAAVKKICVENFDTNGDGELSMNEAKAVKTLGKKFQANKGISFFNELQYFTSIEIIDGFGFYQSSIKELTLPCNVTKIDWGAFEECTYLKSIIIPDGVTSIGLEAFSGCKNLMNISLPNSLTSIAFYAFAGCSSLINITLPEGLTDIGQFVFEGCTNLTSINIPNAVTSIGWKAFAYCKNLTDITIPSSVTDIGIDVFEDCPNLTRIVIMAIEPPIINKGHYGEIGKSIDSQDWFILVPEESLEKYKTNDQWKIYADHIKAIP